MPLWSTRDDRVGRAFGCRTPCVRQPASGRLGHRYDRPMRTTAELREGFLSFFEERGHMRFPSWSLIPPPEDPSTLFISAGMQPLKPFFSGAEAAARTALHHGRRRCCAPAARTPTSTRSASPPVTRRCSRCSGTSRSATTSRTARSTFAWEFVTEHMELDPERIWPTVFAGDPELGLGEDDVAVAGLDAHRDPARADRRAAALRELLGPGRRRPARAARARSSTTTAVRSTAAASPTARRAASAASGSSSSGTSCSWSTTSHADGSLTPLPQAEHRHRARARARCDAAPGSRLDLRHRRLQADHGLDRAGVRRRLRHEPASRPRPTACSAITDEG